MVGKESVERSEGTDRMKVILDNMIRVSGLSVAHKTEIKKALSLNNQIFWKMKKMGKYVGHLSPLVTYYEENKNTGELVLPRGVLQRFSDFCRNKGLQYEIEDRRTKGETLGHQNQSEGSPRVTLRDYQLGIIEAITEQDQGIVRCDTGFGKSIVALKLYETLNVPTLIIVPRTSLKAAFEKDIEKYFGKKPRVPIVVSTLQSLQRGYAKIGDLAEASRYGLVLVDECHTTIPEKSRKVIQSFNCKHLYGLTATARRTDGQGAALQFVYGPILFDGKLPREKPIVELQRFHGHILMGEYAEIIENQTKNEERNTFIASRLVGEVSIGRRILVLTKRIAHGDLILDKLRELAPTAADSYIAIRSEGAAAARSRELDDLRSGRRDFSVLLGTFSLLSTGVDIPSLDTLVIAGDLVSDVLSEQSVGRILRLFEGKKQPKVIDIIDENNPILRRQGRQREKWYREMGWSIV